jgi:hypothetical protein
MLYARPEKGRHLLCTGRKGKEKKSGSVKVRKSGSKEKKKLRDLASENV